MAWNFSFCFEQIGQFAHFRVEFCLVTRKLMAMTTVAN